MNDEKTTAAACVRLTCEKCEIEGKLLCLHTFKDLIDFFVLFVGWAIPFFAGMVMGRFWIGLSIWIALAVVFFGYIEALLLCRHCPHYMEKGSLLRCHANWGLPKIPKISNRPMGWLEKILWLIYVAVLFLYYVPFFIISSQWLLLIITTSALFTAVWTLQRTQCNRCYHLLCPANRVPDDVKQVFYKHYPDYAGERDKPSI